jgi:hypothetical protein
MNSTARCVRVVLSLCGALVSCGAVAERAAAQQQQQVTPVPGVASAADSIVVGLDRALWVTLPDDPGRVGRIATTGARTFPGVGGVRGFPVNAEPHGLVNGDPYWPFWFLLDPPAQFAGMTMSGQTTSFQLSYGRPTSLASGADGALWMTVDAGNGRGMRSRASRRARRVRRPASTVA